MELLIAESAFESDVAKGMQRVEGSSESEGTTSDGRQRGRLISLENLRSLGQVNPKGENIRAALRRVVSVLRGIRSLPVSGWKNKQAVGGGDENRGRN